MNFGMGGVSQFGDEPPIVTQESAGADKGGGAGKGAAGGAMSGAMAGTMAYPGIGTIVGAVLGAAMGAAGGAMSAKGTPGSGPQVSQEAVKKMTEGLDPFQKAPETTADNTSINQDLAKLFQHTQQPPTFQNPYSLNAQLSPGLGFGGQPYSPESSMAPGLGFGGTQYNPDATFNLNMQQSSGMMGNPHTATSPDYTEMLAQLFMSGG